MTTITKSKPRASKSADKRIAEGMLAAVADANKKAEAYQAGDVLIEREDGTFEKASEQPVEEPKGERATATEPAPAPKGLAAADLTKLSLSNQYRKAVVENPTMSLKDLTEKLKAQGIEIRDSTLSTIRSDSLATLSVAKALGKLID